jgi:hypothetical protein
MASAENVVALNDKVSLGVNGLYRGIREPNPSGNGMDTNRAFVGSVSGKVEAKSRDGAMYVRAIPEISGSYDDSILVDKQGGAAKLGVYSALGRLKLNASGMYQERDYVTPSDQQSVYGRINRQYSGEAVYDLWRQYMPLTVGGAFTDASRGGENREYAQYLLSPPGLPSIRVFGMHEGMNNRTNQPRARLVGQDTVPDDSLRTERLNGVVETEWGKSFRHFDRMWVNASYTVNMLTDTLDTAVVPGASAGKDSLAPKFDQKLNQNIFAWVRLSPLKKLQLEIKYVHRIFMDRDSTSSPFVYRGDRIRPEFKLFSQELVPGITLYADYLLQTTDNIISADSEAISLSNNLNSSILIIPGMYWRPLNPFQLSLGYNLLTGDSLDYSGLSGIGTTMTDTIASTSSQTISFKPMLDFSENLHFDSRTEISESRNFSLLTENSVKVYNSARLAFRERKTRFDIDFNVFNDNQYLRDTSLTDTSLVKSRALELRGKWTQRWRPNVRTELDFVASNQNQDFSSFDALSNPTRDSSTGYRNTFTPGILIDLRWLGKTIRELRVQYYIGALLSNGKSLDWSAYDKAQQNKLDIQVKAGANFFLRLLLNVDYYFDQKVLKYDMAELKATALF